VPRYRLHIAYDGTDFHGWQKQFQPRTVAESARGSEVGAGPRVLGPSIIPGDERVELRTVQGVLERALFDLVRQRVTTLGASRTDAGVHARGQTVAFSTTADRLGPPDDRLGRALNSRLPEDVRVEGCFVVADGFDPISDCVAKGYRYALFVDQERPLWERRFVHHVREPLDAERMQRGVERLVGTHDFASFAQIAHGRESSVRTIRHGAVTRCDDDPRRIDITVSGDGFLYNMVRIIAGTLVEVGRGRLEAEELSGVLAAADRRAAGPTLPPTGLTLEWQRYPDPIGTVGETF